MLVLCLSGSPAAAGQAHEAIPPPVHVEIVAAPPPAGQPHAAWLGIRFVMSDGWHIYWQNPGDSGGPPSVKWDLPPGTAAGPLLWPVPERIAAGSIVNYGYHGEVVLPARLSAGAGKWPGEPFVVRADVRWIACREICVPGKSAVSREIRGGFAPTGGEGAALLARAVARVPGPAPPAWRLTGSAAADTFTISLETGRSERDATFFPLVPGQVDAASAVETKPTARGATLTLRRSPYLSKPIDSLKGVLVLGGRGYAADVPLRPTPSAQPPARDGRRQPPARTARSLQ